MDNVTFQKLILTDTYVNIQGSSKHFHQGYWSTDIDLTDINLAQIHYVEELTKLMPIKKGDNILEIGCGTGETSIWLAKKFECSVFAIDIVEANVLKARETVNNQNLEHLIRVEQMDALQMEFLEGTFSHAIGIESIYHIKEKEVLFQKIKHILKAGGYLAFSDYTLERPYSWLLYEVASEMLESKYLTGINDYYKMLSNAGLIVMNIIDVTENTIIKTLENEKKNNYRHVKDYLRQTSSLLSYYLVMLMISPISYLLKQAAKNKKLTLQFIACKNND